jgi:hypothetical protein
MSIFAMPEKTVFKLNLPGSEAPGRKKSYCAITVALPTELKVFRVGQSDALTR